jgi:protein tyrosine phosphatase
MYQKKYDYNLLIFTVEKLCQAVIGKKRIFVHCDAGIDRTGTVTLATLICLGLKKREATEFLISKQPEAAKRLHRDYVDKLVTSVHEAKESALTLEGGKRLSRWVPQPCLACCSLRYS